MLPFPPSVNPHHHRIRLYCAQNGHSCPGCSACDYSGTVTRLQGEIHEVEVTMSIDEPNEKLNAVYVQRNELAVALAAMALRAGLHAGRGIDESKIEGWNHVVYVDLPNGQQVSWHMSPECIELLDILPTYAGEWDKLFTATHKGWSIALGFDYNFNFDDLSVASATGKALDAISTVIGVEPSEQQRADMREMFLRGGNEWDAHVKAMRGEREHRRDAAERTLSEKGYTHQGGVYWKPPVGITGMLGKSLNERQQEHADQNRGRAAVTTLTDMGFEWLGGATWRFKEFHKDTSGKLSVRLSDDELILLAKQAAVECPVQRNYMPKSISTAWAPHQWVIDAMRLAMHKSPGRAIADNRLALVLQHLLHPNCGLAPDLVTQVEKALAAFRNEAEFHVEPPKGEAPSLNETRITRTKELIDFAVLGLEQGCPKADAYAAMLAGIRDTLERTEF